MDSESGGKLGTTLTGVYSSGSLISAHLDLPPQEGLAGAVSVIHDPLWGRVRVGPDHSPDPEPLLRSSDMWIQKWVWERRGHSPHIILHQNMTTALGPGMSPQSPPPTNDLHTWSSGNLLKSNLMPNTPCTLYRMYRTV